MTKRYRQTIGNPSTEGLSRDAAAVLLRFHEKHRKKWRYNIPSGGFKPGLLELLAAGIIEEYEVE